MQQLRHAQPHLCIDDRDEVCVEVAGLIHDLGHGVLSHMFDQKFIPAMNPAGSDWEHEQASADMFLHLIKRNNLKKYFRDAGLTWDDEHARDDVKFIIELVFGAPDKGYPRNRDGSFKYKEWQGRWGVDERTGRRVNKNFLYQIVANKTNGIDVDKWDYFQRDCRQLNMSVPFDADRLLMFARVLDDADGNPQICFPVKEAWTVYQMFQARYSLHKRAYQHKVSRCIENMYMEALIAADSWVSVPSDDPPDLRPGFVLPTTPEEEAAVTEQIRADCNSLSRCRMSQSIHNMYAYSRLSDYLLRQIATSTVPELWKARSIIHRILRRDIYAWVGETILPAYVLETQRGNDSNGASASSSAAVSSSNSNEAGAVVASSSSSAAPTGRPPAAISAPVAGSRKAAKAATNGSSTGTGRGLLAMGFTRAASQAAPAAAAAAGDDGNHDGSLIHLSQANMEPLHHGSTAAGAGAAPSSASAAAVVDVASSQVFDPHTGVRLRPRPAWKEKDKARIAGELTAIVADMPLHEKEAAWSRWGWIAGGGRPSDAAAATAAAGGGVGLVSPGQNSNTQPMLDGVSDNLLDDDDSNIHSNSRPYDEVANAHPAANGGGGYTPQQAAAGSASSITGNIAAIGADGSLINTDADDSAMYGTQGAIANPLPADPAYCSMTSNDIWVDIVTIDFGKKDQDPVKSYVSFYTTDKQTGQLTITRVGPDQVSTMVPACFQEQYVRLYVKRKEIRHLAVAAFEVWCARIKGASAPTMFSPARPQSAHAGSKRARADSSSSAASSQTGAGAGSVGALNLRGIR